MGFVDLVIFGNMVKCLHSSIHCIQGIPIDHNHVCYHEYTALYSIPATQKSIENNSLQRILIILSSLNADKAQIITDEPPMTFPLVQQQRLSFIAWQAVTCGCVLEREKKKSKNYAFISQCSTTH